MRACMSASWPLHELVQKLTPPWYQPLTQLSTSARWKDDVVVDGGVVREHIIDGEGILGLWLQWRGSTP
jgi:hypothetical protein